MTAVLQRPDTFKGLLLAATVLPVLCAFAFPLGLASETALPGQPYLFVMTFISVAHVPATLYLLFDRDLVGQSDLSRRQTVIVPLALIVFVPVLLLSVTPRAEGSPSPPLYFIWVAYLMWQHWHFGRQNLGVFTFCLMGPEGRRISDFERLTINLASLCGILAICGRYATALKQKYVGDAPLLVHDFLSSWVFEAGMALQIGLTIASILYLVRYLRSYTPLSATIYLCAVSFFLPMYFEPGFTLPHYAAGHGLQYMVFLAFHAVAMSNLGKPRTSEETASRIPVAENALPASRHVLIDRAIRQLKSPQPLFRSDPEQELREYQRVLARLLVPGGILSGAKAAEAITVRGARFVEQGGATGRRAAITNTVKVLPVRARGVMYLAELSKTDFLDDHADDIIEQLDNVFGARVIDELCRRSLAPKGRMVTATGAYQATVTSNLPDDVKNRVAEHIDGVLERYLTDENIIEKLDNPDTHLRDRAVRLVKFCGAGVLPDGKAQALARQRIIKMLRQPNFDENFVEGLGDPESAAAALRDFHKLLVKAGFA